jgi:hypothetical protein
MIVFFITAGVYLAGALGFIFLGSGEVQEWAIKKKPATTTSNEVELEERVPLKNRN